MKLAIVIMALVLFSIALGKAIKYEAQMANTWECTQSNGKQICKRAEPYP